MPAFVACCAPCDDTGGDGAVTVESRSPLGEVLPMAPGGADGNDPPADIFGSTAAGAAPQAQAQEQEETNEKPALAETGEQLAPSEVRPPAAPPEPEQNLKDIDVPPDGRKAFEFEVQICEKHGSLGLALDATQSGFHVLDVLPFGALSAYNRTAEAKKAVRVDDFIVSSNGVRDARQMATTFAQSDALKLRLVRPAYVTVQIPAGQKGLGMRLGNTEDISRFLGIQDIRTGGVNDYNSTAPEELQVRVGDFIAEVNGTTKLSDMLTQIRDASEGKLKGKLTLRIAKLL